MRKIASLAVVGALGLLGAAPLHASDVTFKACAGSPSKADEDAARGLFAAGRTAYEEGDYPKAIQYWRDAFDRDCTATLLLVNLANAYEKKGDVDAAIVALETYLQRSPKADDAPTIQKRVENMRKLKAAAAASSSAARPATSAPPPPPSAPPAVETTASPAPRLGPFIVMGAGGLVTIVGGVLYLGGASKVSDAEALCPSRINCTAEAADKGNSGRSQKKLGVMLTGAGLLTVGGGVAWYFLDKRKAPSTAVTPLLAPGTAGVGVIGRF